MKPMDRAIYWVEYVLRHNGASHLRSSCVPLNFTQYFSIDVCCICISVITVGIFLFTKVTKYFFTTKNIKPSKKKN